MISEAKAQLSALIEKVLAGEEIIIGEAGSRWRDWIRYERGLRNAGPVR